MTGPQLNKIVWELFSKAGFETKPNSSDASEHIIKLSERKKRTPDLLALDRDLSVRIIGENKTGSEKGSVTKLINDLSELRKVDRAQAALIVSLKEEFEQDDIDYAASKKIFIWNKDKLAYYSTLVDTLGPYSKYEIIHSFKIHTKEQKYVHNTIGLKFQQPFENSAANVFLFTISPDILLKTCVIFRRAQGSSEAYQRMVKKKRLKSIKNFISKENSLLPTNILVYFSEDINHSSIKTPLKDIDGKAINLTSENAELVNMQIPLKYGSMELLDGQHRLYGFLDTEPGTKKNFNLVVVGIQGLTNISKRDTFIAINDNARRMDPNLVAFLKYNSDETECQRDNELMAIKVAFELSKTTHSPFKDKIRLLDIGDQVITLKGIAGYDLKGLLGKKSPLRQWHNNTSSEYVTIFKDYFNVIKSNFKTQYDDPHKYIIFTNKGVSAFLKLFKSILRTENNILTKGVFEKYIRAVRKHSTDKEWEILSMKSKYVGSQGWKEFHNYLISLVRMDYPDFKD